MTLLSSIRFDNFDLPETLREGIRASGFDHATLVQAQVLPLALAGKDVAAQAQTGTGKTAAFLIVGMNRLLRVPRPAGAPGPRFLIVAPTRELVVQIADDARRLAAATALKITAVFGGIDYARQRDEVRQHPDILVGTPGRLLDYEDQRATTFRSVEVLVLDEADRMFDLGFLRDIRRIFRKCPPYNRRQSMLFSATLSPRATELAYEHMNDAVRISIEPEQITAQGITEILYHVASHEKLRLLLGLLERDRFERTLIFVNRKDTAAELETRLATCGVTAAVLAGNVRQQRRLRILNDFKEGKLPVMIATDVASRGLHIEGVTHVINFDLPQDAEDYVHRVGRTARAGALGEAISFADEEYVFSLDAIEKLLGRKIPSKMADPSLFRELPREAAARPRPQYRRPAGPPRPGSPRGPRGGPRPAAHRAASPAARPPAGPREAPTSVTYGRGRGRGPKAR